VYNDILGLLYWHFKSVEALTEDDIFIWLRQDGELTYKDDCKNKRVILSPTSLRHEYGHDNDENTKTLRRICVHGVDLLSELKKIYELKTLPADEVI
jgi:hypothetical protein